MRCQCAQVNCAGVCLQRVHHPFRQRFGHVEGDQARSPQTCASFSVKINLIIEEVHVLPDRKHFTQP
jgi:hypothetical protein